MKLSPLLFVLLFFVCIKTHGAIFTVTTNADAGAGSLREAITLSNANGIAVQDMIYFNLPITTIADRTIILKSELPYLAGNVLIDGTTQPGAQLGTSDAKVIITLDRSTYRATGTITGCLMMTNVSNIEIYGLEITGFESISNPSFPSAYISSAAVYFAFCENVVIGAPGKGNVFGKNDYAVFGLDVLQVTSKEIKVQSNWFNLDHVGQPIYGAQGTLIRGHNVVFGGATLAEGNVIAGGNCNFSGNNWKVTNNRFNLDPFGNRAGGGEVSLQVNKGEVTDNLGAPIIMQLSYSNDILLLRNKDILQSLTTEANLYIDYSENIIVGTDNLTDANIFTNKYTAITGNASKNVEIRKNSITCTSWAYFTRFMTVPSIKVMVNTDSEYSGIATPFSEVYIYNDNLGCASCSPVVFYTKIITDATGAWKITGDFTNNRFTANATLLKSSSEYTQPQILSSSSGYWYVKTDPSCGLSNGKLGLTETLHLLKVEWYNQADEKVGEGLTIENLPAGRYYAKGFNGNCFTKSATVDLFNVEPKFFDQNLKVQNPGCGQNNGSITGLFYYVGMQTSFKWVDANNNTLSTSSTDLNNIGPGSYTLVVTTADGCARSYGPITLQNTSGPNINRSAQTITEANCGTNDGTINGITATGTGNLQYVWKNTQGTTVGQTVNLNGAGAGSYTLTVTDQSACAPLSETFIIPEKNSIVINTTGMRIDRPTCTGNNGGIAGITVTGATNYKWVDELNKTVSVELALTGVGPGSYYLIASNSFCSKQTESILIQLQPNLINIIGTSKVITNASCGLNNGSIQVIIQNPVTLPIAYRWADANGNTLGSNSLLLDGVTEGTYTIYGIDANNCEKFLANYTVGRTQMLQVDRSHALELADQCNQQIGSIKGLTVTGGTLPLTYKWTNENGQTKGNALILQNIGAGVYTLLITDALGCTFSSSDYQIGNEQESISMPAVKNVQLCGPGKVTIAVDNPASGSTYQLYTNENSAVPLAKSATGIFTVAVEQSGNFYVSQVIGNCESAKTMMKVTIGLSALTMSNTITPNNDLINDNWQIKSIENYPKALVQIFNRLGTKVFESVGYKTPFNGTANGKTLPTGVYYYLINFGSECGIIKGSLTIIN